MHVLDLPAFSKVRSEHSGLPNVVKNSRNCLLVPLGCLSVALACLNPHYRSTHSINSFDQPARSDHFRRHQALQAGQSVALAFSAPPIRSTSLPPSTCACMYLVCASEHATSQRRALARPLARHVGLGGFYLTRFQNSPLSVFNLGPTALIHRHIVSGVLLGSNFGRHLNSRTSAQAAAAAGAQDGTGSWRRTQDTDALLARRARQLICACVDVCGCLYATQSLALAAPLPAFVFPNVAFEASVKLVDEHKAVVAGCVFISSFACACVHCDSVAGLTLERVWFLLSVYCTDRVACALSVTLRFHDSFDIVADQAEALEITAPAAIDPASGHAVVSVTLKSLTAANDARPFCLELRAADSGASLVWTWEEDDGSSPTDCVTISCWLGSHRVGLLDTGDGREGEAPHGAAAA